jgi:hypothetical protein
MTCKKPGLNLPGIKELSNFPERNSTVATKSGFSGSYCLSKVQKKWRC